VTGFAVSSNRTIKARKIEAVLSDFLGKDAVEEMTILDIGCGSGIIAEYFSRRNRVYCADVDNQLSLDGMDSVIFRKIQSASLPFDDSLFDIVISNHVIEHVKDQPLHLKEIRRVLKPKGVCYLATPNRNFPIEPHYRIPLINYLPNRSFHFLLKLLRRYQEDLFLLRHGDMINLFLNNKFAYVEYTADVLKNPSQYQVGVRFQKHIPLPVMEMIEFLMPTNIFLLRKTV
jgi:ubiquinone/menaquinone biosynthesis C-methylase UbiE